MNLIRAFIKKEIRGIIQSRRLILSLLAGLVACTILNIIANIPGSTPMFGMNLINGIISINLCVAILSADIIYVTMIDEISYGTFDVLYISKCGINRIILLKCLLPIISAIAIIYAGLFINNIFASFFSDLIVLNTKWDYLIWVLFVSFGCIFVEYGRCINDKFTVPKSNDYISLIVGGVYAILHYFSNGKLKVMVYVVAVVLTIGSYCYAYKKMKRNIKYTKKKKEKHLIKIKDSKYKKAVLSREIRRLFSNKKVLVKIFSLTLCAATAIGFLPNGIQKNISVIFMMYLLAMVFFSDVYLESVKLELNEKMGEILLIAHISKKSHFKLMLFFAELAGFCFGSLSIIIYLVFCVVNQVDVSGFRFYFEYVIGLTVCGLFAYIFSYRYYNSIKDSKFVRRFVVLVSFLVYVSVCVWFASSNIIFL